MSSTTGIRSGDLIREVQRLRKLLDRHRQATRRIARLTRSRDHWRQRALAAEWANRTRKENTP